jgi:chromosome segregation ATPase
MSDDPILSALARLEAGQADMSDRLARLEAGQADMSDRLARLESGQANMSDRLGRLEASVARIDAGVTRLETRVAAVEAEQTRLREQINTKLDDILDKLSANRADIHTASGHILYALESNLTLSQRITKIEEELRRR